MVYKNCYPHPRRAVARDHSEPVAIDNLPRIARRFDGRMVGLFIDLNRRPTSIQIKITLGEMREMAVRDGIVFFGRNKP
jgi:hypothetical protein